MTYWLMKSEPDTYSWSRLLKEKRASWDGVRNYQANNNMKAMALNDQAFFYHSNSDRAIVGIMKIVKTWYLDPSDATGRFGMVDVMPVKSLRQPISLATIKAQPKLQAMVLVKHSRLSVSPVKSEEWRIILELSNRP